MIDLLLKRRSIRKYKKTRIGKYEMETILQAGLLAPSGRGVKPWEFVVVEEEPVLEALSKAKPHGGAFLKDAPLAIVVLADTEKTDVWVEDASIALTLMQLTAETLGLGSCWVQIRKRPHDESESAGEHIKRLLKVPDCYAVEAVLAVGHPDETRPPRELGGLDWSKIHRERWEG